MKTKGQSAGSRDAAHRNADRYFVTPEQRISRAKEQLAADSAASDAKTSRLRALRLSAGKDATPAEPAAKRSPKKRILSIKV